MNKDINYYMSLPYTRELIRESNGIWFVQIKELPGCMSQGSSPEEALRMIDDAMRGWLEIELGDGEIIPEPRMDEDFSGKFVMRVPKSLHRKLVGAAEDDGVSLNQWIVAALAEALGSVVATGRAIKVEKPRAFAGQPMEALSVAIHNILKDVGMQMDAGISEEACFANWLEENFHVIQSNYQDRDFEQSMARIQALVEVLKEYKDHSPIINLLATIFENAGALTRQVSERDRIVTAIQSLIIDVNIPKKQRFQTKVKDSNHEVIYKIIEKDKWTVLKAKAPYGTETIN